MKNTTYESQFIQILLIALVPFLVLWFWQEAPLETSWIDTQIRGHGWTGGILFFLTGIAFTAVGFPRQVLAFLAGYAFDFLLGTGVALLATVFGAVIAFQYARFRGRTFLLHRFLHKIKKIDDFLAGNTILMTVVLRLSPFTNNLATNLAGGVSGVRRTPFFLGSSLGYLPQTLIFALLGSGFLLDPMIRTGLSVGLFILSSFLGVWLWRRFRRGLPEELPEAE